MLKYFVHFVFFNICCKTIRSLCVLSFNKLRKVSQQVMPSDELEEVYNVGKTHSVFLYVRGAVSASDYTFSMF